MFVGIDSYVEYSEESPSYLIWKVEIKSRGIKVGDSAGSFDPSKGYYITKIEGKKYRNHRIIYYLFNNSLDENALVDHKDGNKVNNHKDNLRAVTIEINNRNLGVRKDSKTGVTGICLKGSSYVACYYDSKKPKTKSFSCVKLGTEEAFKQACAWRKAQLTALNNGYTERHGTG